jgi:hypothetical protein
MWPDIPYPSWRETCAALHLYTQVAGKYRLARTPWVNHSWHATFYVTARGLTTSLIPDGPGGGITVDFDLIEHAVIGANAGGGVGRIELEPMSVADFDAKFRGMISELGGNASFNGRPNEIADAVPFAEDEEVRPYDAEAVRRFHLALVQIDRVFKQFRTGFLGKVSPVHLFWGSFDFAVTRFSGQKAPLHPGGIPALPDEVTREAYSHEVSSAGFWPGGGAIDYPAFYSYAYPAPAGFADARILPEAAFYSAELGEFVLPYEAVRKAANPDATLLAFLDSTYEAAAKLGAWDRANLECEPGEALRSRPL